MEVAEVLEVTLRVGEMLDRLGVAWLVGGSLASSVHGTPRSTQDVDLVADLEPGHAAPLVALAGDEFYADVAMIADAIRARRSFNLLHLPTNFKIDVFVARRDALSRSEMDRRQRVRVRDEPPGVLPVASPEDTILQKLAWFRLGDEVSERQWGDALGVALVRTDLDQAYLDRWADQLGLEPLLRRLRDEVARRRGD